MERTLKEDWLASVDREPYCYLTTVGRRTGQPHVVEIWFGVHDGALYLLAGGRDQSDWVRNVIRHPQVEVRFGTREASPHLGQARVVHGREEPALDATARSVLAAKYQGWTSGQPLSSWARTALAVEIRLSESAATTKTSE